MTTEPQEPPQQQEPAWMAGLVRLIERQGGEGPTAQLLYQENKQHRDRIKQLEDEARQLREAAQAAEPYTALNLTPDQIATALQERDTLVQRVQEAERMEVIRQAAELHGYKAGVLAKLPGLPAISIGTHDGSPAAFVQDGDKQTLLADYLTANHADFLPALQPTEAASGVPHPAQGTGPANRKPTIDEIKARKLRSREYSPSI